MQDILKLQEAEVQELKDEQKKCRSATMKTLTDFHKLLNGNTVENSEEGAAAIETVAQA